MKTSKIVVLVAAVTAAVWAVVLVSTVTVVVRQEPSVPLALGRSSWSAGAGSDTESLAVASSQPWTATGDASWLTVTPASGRRSTTVRLAAAPNATQADRFATLTVTSAGTVRTMTVRQRAPHPDATPGLDLDQDAWDVASQGGTTVVGVTAGQPWTASADAAWVGVQTDTAAGTLTLTATANAARDPRSVLVTVSDGTTSATVVVNQAGQGVVTTLTLGLSSWSPGAGATSRKVSVTCDQGWTAVSNQSWATVDPSRGSGDGTLTVGVKKNGSSTSRTATIQVTGGGTTRTIRVVQAGASRSTPSSSPRPSTPPTTDPPVAPPVDPPAPPVDPPVDPPEPPEDPPAGAGQ